ncbi:MAG: hypothetical protein ACLFNX_09820, partial [Spirochaetaceae bacterium]
MSRLLFKRYLIPLSLPALTIPPALVILGAVAALVLRAGSPDADVATVTKTGAGAAEHPGAAERPGAEIPP